jgi:hypothetical protein
MWLSSQLLWLSTHQFSIDPVQLQLELERQLDLVLVRNIQHQHQILNQAVLIALEGNLNLQPGGRGLVTELDAERERAGFVDELSLQHQIVGELARTCLHTHGKAQQLVFAEGQRSKAAVLVLYCRRGMIEP